MNQSEYESLIKALCADIGISEADEAVSTQHITLNNHLVGLAIDPHGDHMLQVMFEIDLTFPERDQGLYHRMLMANMRDQLPGTYCIHPESCSAVYRLRLDMREVAGGGALAELLASQLEIARDTFIELMVPV